MLVSLSGKQRMRDLRGPSREKLGRDSPVYKPTQPTTSGMYGIASKRGVTPTGSGTGETIFAIATHVSRQRFSVSKDSTTDTMRNPRTVTRKRATSIVRSRVTKPDADLQALMAPSENAYGFSRVILQIRGGVYTTVFVRC